jgi:hypothetical protein
MNVGERQTAHCLVTMQYHFKKETQKRQAVFGNTESQRRGHGPEVVSRDGRGGGEDPEKRP